MFSEIELAVIEVDTSHILRTVSLDGKRKIIRENIVKKITSHNPAMDAIALLKGMASHAQTPETLWSFYACKIEDIELILDQQPKEKDN